MLTKQLTWKGNISYAQPQGRGEYPGAMAIKFRSIEAYNQYFAPGQPGEALMCIDKTEVPILFGLLGVHVYAMVTNQLSPEELQDMMEVDREVQFAMAGRRKERLEAKEKQDREAAAVKQEMARLANVGSKYEARVKNMKAMDPTKEDRKEVERLLNGGDPDVLFDSKLEAFQTGYLRGHDNGHKAAMADMENK